MTNIRDITYNLTSIISFENKFKQMILHEREDIKRAKLLVKELKNRIGIVIIFLKIKSTSHVVFLGKEILTAVIECCPVVSKLIIRLDAPSVTFGISINQLMN